MPETDRKPVIREVGVGCFMTVIGSSKYKALH